MVVHKEILQLTDKPFAQIVNVLDVCEAVIVFLNRYHAVISHVFFFIALLPFYDAAIAPKTCPEPLPGGCFFKASFSWEWTGKSPGRS